MAATRTQVYLTKEQRARLDELRRRDGRPLAELVREAIDGYLESSAPSVDDALQETAGALPELEVPTRDEWDRGRG
jgi:hypothetical protein